MPCLFPSSEHHIVVKAMHETVFVHRLLSDPPAAELDVVAVVEVLEVVPREGAILTLFHRGRIGQPENTTQRWAQYVQGNGQDWFAEIVNRSWPPRGRLAPGENANLVWQHRDGQQEVAVRPKGVTILHTLDGVPQPSVQCITASEGPEDLYSTFAVKFDSPGLQVFGFRFSTNHGVRCVGGDELEVEVEGPQTGVNYVRDRLAREGADGAALNRVTALWGNCCMSPGDYVVAVVPHPTLDPFIRWKPRVPVPARAEEIMVDVHKAPEDFSFSLPHSEARVIVLAPATMEFVAPIVHRVRDTAAETMAALLDIWEQWEKKPPSRGSSGG
jgi:hypothetical protein